MKKIIFHIAILLFFMPLSLKAKENIMYEVFFNLRNDYINTLTNKEIAFKGLKSISKLNKNMDLKETSKKLVLYNKNRMIKQFEFPDETADITKWQAWCEQIMDTAANADPVIEKHRTTMEDQFAVAVFEGLDGYSHYFGTLTPDDDNKPLKIRRPFASRVIDNILLVKILRFKKGIAEQVRTAVEECSKCEALILDLRNNHGGFLDESLQIANLFLDEGIITYTLSYDNHTPKYYTADRGDILHGKPIVILTDGLTASASEILAACLSEQNRAILIGTKTYGKGTIQDVKKMDKDKAMTMTTAYFYTPSGLKIDKVGLTPFICVGKDNDCSKADRFNKDEDIELAVRFLKTGNVQ